MKTIWARCCQARPIWRLQVLEALMVVASLLLYPASDAGHRAAISGWKAQSVLFVQNRVGRGGASLKIYKFRSMVCDSKNTARNWRRKATHALPAPDASSAKTRLDELPQFWNIIKGDMAPTYPRPEQKAFVQQFEQSIPFYGYRHIVRPGLLGWAQVMQNTPVTQTKPK